MGTTVVRPSFKSADVVANHPAMIAPMDSELWPWMDGAGWHATSARRKLEHGIALLHQLITEIDEYEDAKAYEFPTTIQMVSSRVTRFECHARERKPPETHWALRAGDVVQNLRAALDHVVWAATPPQYRTRWTGFPICDRGDEFRQAKTRSNPRNACAFVDEQVLAAIRRAQPYVRATNAEERAWEPLFRLAQLSNEDKHQTLATVAAVVDEVFVVAARETNVSFTKLGTGRPLGPGESHVATIEIDEDAVVKSALPTFIYKVLIAGREAQDLERLAHDVFRTLWECEFKQEMPVWTPPWPI